jgi:hypothetical protein
MKILIVLIIFVLALGTLFFDDSYGEKSLRKHPSLPEIKLQLEYRNSDGVLTGYEEPTIFYLRNINMIHEHLDQNKRHKTIITIDGKEYEKFEFRFEQNLTKGKQYAQFGIGHKNTQVLISAHIGYIAEKGDTLVASWKIVRTAR